MKKPPLLLSALALGGSLGMTAPAIAGGVADAITSGTVSGDFRLRFEDVDQDNPLKDASALTLRSRLGYTTAEYEGFSAKVEFEDNRVVAGQDDYSVPPTDFNKGEYSVIADPEFTELDQGYLQYKQGELTAKLGRQVITYDNHRFIGHVGWRQDRQVYDAFTLKYAPAKDLTLNYGYIAEREGIFAQELDVDSKDHLFNVKYESGVGTLVGYGYLLETDSSDPDASIDTYGLRYSGSQSKEGFKVLYTLEYAQQEWSMESSSTEYDADYLFAELGVVVSGVTIKLGYEVLGSDDAMYGFMTPLATLHKFNGWTDQFLGTPKEGLVDTMLTVSTKIAGGKLVIVYHDFSADEDTDTIDDYGREWNAVYSKKFGKNVTAGIKYANYSAGDDATGKFDTDKLWLWTSLTF